MTFASAAFAELPRHYLKTARCAKVGTYKLNGSSGAAPVVTDPKTSALEAGAGTGGLLLLRAVAWRETG